MLIIVSNLASAARNVESKRECATCHIMWLDEFKRKDVTTLIPYEPKPVTQSGRQDVSSTERMCFSCHDGFVLDSRFMWQDETHSHPVGIKPSKKIKIPTSQGKTIFPLNDDGKIYCGTCHSAHGVDWGNKISPIFLRVENIESSLCLACHLDKSTGSKEGNHPIFKKPTQQPEGLLEAGAKFADDGSVICQSCHKVHGGKQKSMLIKSNVKAELCYSCHKDKRGLVNSKHDMTVMEPEMKNNHGDEVKKTGPCSACHVPHGADEPGLWARNISPKEKDRAAAKCVTCHTEGGVAKDKLTGVHSHPVNLALDKLGIDVDPQGWKSQHDWAQGNDAPLELPLFDKQGQRTHNQGRISCLTCHDPHNWSVEENLKKVVNPKNSEGDGNSSFLRIAQGQDSKLCMNCHIDKRSITQTTHNIDPLNNKTDTCSHCHAVHNAKGITLRNRDLGSGKSTIESWCKNCHQKDGLADDKLIGEHSHPLGVRPKQLAKGSALPLFDKAGKRNQHDGLVDCASCHNPHQWTPQTAKPSKNKATEKEGDGSNSYLRLAANHDSKLCVSCHKDNGLVIGTDHDLNVTAPDATNGLGQSAHQSGVCGQCHAVHNPLLKNNLWSQKLGEGHDIKEQQCRGCHNKDGVAKEKVPLALQHPEEVMAWSEETRQLPNNNSLPDVPVYNKDGEKAGAGFISCPSCHNPHQWNPREEVVGKGENIEGDALTSFLRNANSERILCADCHGKDSLFRYKYYHGKTSRKQHPLYR